MDFYGDMTNMTIHPDWIKHVAEITILAQASLVYCKGVNPALLRCERYRYYFIYVLLCIIYDIIYIPYIYHIIYHMANYNDLTVTSLESCLVRESSPNGLISG
jgi:hypothetical protein